MTNHSAPMQPSHVVVDTRDGYVFWRGGDGALFNKQTADTYAAIQNTALNHPIYVVRRLVEPSSLVISAEQATMYAERGRKLTEIRKILAGFKIETTPCAAEPTTAYSDGNDQPLTRDEIAHEARYGGSKVPEEDAS